MIEVNRNPSSRELAIFSLLLGLFLVVLAFLANGRQWLVVARTLVYLAPLVALLGVVLAFRVPAWLRPLYVGWMVAVFPIGWVVSHVLLAAIYYLIVTPIGVLMGVLGYDPMQRDLDSARESYWVERKPSGVDRYFKQF